MLTERSETKKEHRLYCVSFSLSKAARHSLHHTRAGNARWPPPVGRLYTPWPSCSNRKCTEAETFSYPPQRTFRRVRRAFHTVKRAQTAPSTVRGASAAAEPVPAQVPRKAGNRIATLTQLVLPSWLLPSHEWKPPVPRPPVLNAANNMSLEADPSQWNLRWDPSPTDTLSAAWRDPCRGPCSAVPRLLGPRSPEVTNVHGFSTSAFVVPPRGSNRHLMRL
ncbi:uncharacterized protein LOC118006291 [Mirounga leonina]|uniref:uncharacterized protein LOC118006291 n=1 Tax=Mirounga leonina TaxID=9715 RepID=UPI00156C466A|nr:uncharacterized protein LOC118006291 [Mirounga leonina]